MTAVASGMTMRLIPKTTYTFSNLAASSNMSFLLCQHIDCSVFQEASFLVRVHSGTIGTTATIKIDVVADGWTLEDPGIALTSLNDASGTALGNFTLANGGALTAAYGLINVAKPSGRLLSVQITGTQVAAVQTITAAISIDLTLKAGDPSNLPLDYNTYRGYRI
jgi:hypothetical protein